MLALSLARVGAVCAEVLGGVRRICGANNSSSSCRQNLFAGDERVELSARPAPFLSVVIIGRLRVVATVVESSRDKSRGTQS
jgi:hypothetical protein